MKIVINVQEDMNEDEIHLYCKELNDDIVNIQKLIEKQLYTTSDMLVFKEGVEYYIEMKDILFFETSGREMIVHTVDNFFVVKKKLYELELDLPSNFTRISKSCIVNVSQIYSINKNVVSNGLIEFRHTHKQVYVSRIYYKSLKHKLELRRNVYE